MTADNDTGPGGAPAPLAVRYSRRVHAFRTAAILAIAGICGLIPFAAAEQGPGTWRFASVLIAAALAWAVTAAMRMHDRRPQVLIDENGVFFREWLVGTVPWENIDFIAHSSSVRRGILASITRTRRKPYLLFGFVAAPGIVTTTPPPLSWLQHIRAEFAIQEPAIQQYGLDTPVETILTSIRAHIEHWRSQRENA